MTCHDTLAQQLRDLNIEEVECVFPDIAGNPRGKRIPLEKYLNEETKVVELIFTQGIDGSWVELDEALLDPSEKDMSLQADVSTCRQLPWAQKPTVQITHDCVVEDQQLFSMAPRSVLKRILELYRLEGWKPVVAPEIEFYLVDKNTDPQSPLQPPIGSSGRRCEVGQTLQMDLLHEFAPFIETLYNTGRAMNIDLDVLVQEDGPGQLEVNLQHGDPLLLADQVLAFKRAARFSAEQHGLQATFMAKPYGHQAGSSMHIHQSLIDEKTGQNMFASHRGEASPQLLHFIAGLQRYTPDVLAFYAPYVNSYRRFSKLFPSSATNLDWGYDNRTTAIRVPVSSLAATRVENRYAGIDCNPYLAMAASLACGYLGLKQQLMPSTPIEGDADQNKPIALARSLESALLQLDAAEEIKELLGSEFVTLFLALQWQEFEGFNTDISAWERQHLLLQA